MWRYRLCTRPRGVTDRGSNDFRRRIRGGGPSRSLHQHDELSAELKGGPRPQIDNSRYTARVERAQCIVTPYRRTSYRIIHMARLIEAAKILKARGIRGGLPDIRSIMGSLLSKPSGYITKANQWAKWRASCVYGSPVAGQLPVNMPTPKATAGELQASEKPGRL